MIWDAHPGSGFISITDPGVKIAQDPGSGYQYAILPGRQNSHPNTPQKIVKTKNLLVMMRLKFLTDCCRLLSVTIFLKPQEAFLTSLNFFKLHWKHLIIPATGTKTGKSVLSLNKKNCEVFINPPIFSRNMESLVLSSALQTLYPVPKRHKRKLRFLVSRLDLQGTVYR